MENKNETQQNQDKRHDTPDNPHQRPQNASGNAGKELASDQNQPEFDQSKENEAHLNQAGTEHGLHKPNENAYPQGVKTTQDNPLSEANPDHKAFQPDAKQPIDRPAREEDQEML